MNDIAKQLDEMGDLRVRLDGLRGCKRVQDVMKVWRADSWEDLSQEKKAQIQAFPGRVGQPGASLWLQ